MGHKGMAQRSANASMIAMFLRTGAISLSPARTGARSPSLALAHAARPMRRLAVTRPIMILAVRVLFRL
jgi:hypothetical protein